MRSLLILLPVFLFSSLNAQNNTEDLISLDGNWKFKTDPYARGEALNWFEKGTNDHDWDSMPVPGNWDLRNEYSNYAGKAWYRKEFSIPGKWRSRFIRILFEAVAFESKVWINGKLLGTNNIGYLPFEYDVSELLDYDGINSITVLCDNTYRLGALWNWGGIRRPVKLVATSPIYVKGQFISPVIDLKKHTADITTKVICHNNGIDTEQVDGTAIIFSGGKAIRSVPFKLTLPAGTSREVFVKTSLSAKEVHLWNCDDPYLYQSKISVSKNDKIVHTSTERFGLRKIELDNKNFLFKLNGESIRPVGFNLVADDRTTGSTLPLWRIMEDVDMMKSMGANMARLTHLPMHKEMLDYLDEKGILVFAEIPLWGYHQLVNKNNPVAKQWLQRLIYNNYNHASIIGWSVGNEIGESPGVMEYVEDAIKYVKANDTTRLAVMVSHTANRHKDPITFSDLGLVNKYGVSIGHLAEEMHSRHPEKTLFYSEFGYGQMRETLDTDADAKGMMDSIRFKPYLIGGALWTFNDYRSNYNGTREYSETRPWGIVDVFRRKKKAWYSFRKEYAPIRDMTIESIPGGKPSSITITPRMLLDLPAYTLRDYTLVWQGYDENDKITDGGFAGLPVITPGCADIKQPVKWNNENNLSYYKLEIITPGNYTVYDTIIFIKKKQVVNTGGSMQTNPILRGADGQNLDPPVISYTEPSDHGFYVGYITEKDDYVFRIQYTTIPGDYSNAVTIQSTTKGVLFVPGLKNGVPYYFRMRKIKDSNYLTEWSEEYTITPDGQQLPLKPILKGVFCNKKEALLIFDPVKKATGYTVQYRVKNTDNWNVMDINTAVINHIRITGLNPKAVYEFRIASHNIYGQSELTDPLISRTTAGELLSSGNTPFIQYENPLH